MERISHLSRVSVPKLISFVNRCKLKWVMGSDLMKQHISSTSHSSPSMPGKQQSTDVLKIKKDKSMGDPKREIHKIFHHTQIPKMDRKCLEVLLLKLKFRIYNVTMHLRKELFHVNLK